jgi:polyisoprenoid-binding protein YceI
MKSLVRTLPGLVLALAAATLSFAAPQPLQIDPTQTRVDIAVQATADSFTGHLQHCEPVISLGDDGAVTAVRVPFHFRDVVTGKPKRDAAMHEWQQTDKFPDGEFVLSSLTPDQPGHFTAKGRLTFHGVSQELSFPVTIAIDHYLYTIDGVATLNTTAYALPIVRVMAFLKVDPVVKVGFHLQGHAA